MDRRSSVVPRGILGDEGARRSSSGRELAAPPRITDELIAMEGGDKPFTDRARAARNAIVAARGPRYATDLVATLVHRVLPPARAHELFERIRAHKIELARTLGRDPGIRVAALDFVANVEKEEGDVDRVGRAAFRASAEAGRRDPDTGLVDRATLELLLDRALVDATKRKMPLAIVVLRVEGDGFVPAHLASLALAIEGACREGDVAARFAPDALALLLVDADAPRARAFVERLSGIGGDLPPTCRIRFGLAVHPEDGRATRALLRAAGHPLES